MYQMDGKVCLTNFPNFCSGKEFHGVVNHFIDKKESCNTKFKTNLTIQAVYGDDLTE